MDQGAWSLGARFREYRLHRGVRMSARSGCRPSTAGGECGASRSGSWEGSGLAHSRDESKASAFSVGGAAAFTWWEPADFFRLGFLATATSKQDVPEVFEGDEDDEAKKEERAASLEGFENAALKWFFADCFADGHGDVTSIQHGEGQEVHDGEVDVEDDTEPKHLKQGVGALEEVKVDTTDADGSAHVGGTDV